MRVLISDPPAQLSCPAVVGILQIGRHRKITGLLYKLFGGKNRVYSRIALGCGGDIGGRLSQYDLCLRKTDPLAGKRAGNVVDLGEQPIGQRSFLVFEEGRGCHAFSKIGNGYVEVVGKNVGAHNEAMRKIVATLKMEKE